MVLWTFLHWVTTRIEQEWEFAFAHRTLSGSWPDDEPKPRLIQVDFSAVPNLAGEKLDLQVYDPDGDGTPNIASLRVDRDGNLTLFADNAGTWKRRLSKHNLGSGYGRVHLVVVKQSKKRRLGVTFAEPNSKGTDAVLKFVLFDEQLSVEQEWTIGDSQHGGWQSDFRPIIHDVNADGSDDFIYANGKGFGALDLVSGKTIWERQVYERFGPTAIRGFDRHVNELHVVTERKRQLLGVDILSGNTKWRTPVPEKIVFSRWDPRFQVSNLKGQRLRGILSGEADRKLCGRSLGNGSGKHRVATNGIDPETAGRAKLTPATLVASCSAVRLA